MPVRLTPAATWRTENPKPAQAWDDMMMSSFGKNALTTALAEFTQTGPNADQIDGVLRYLRILQNLGREPVPAKRQQPGLIPDR